MESGVRITAGFQIGMNRNISEIVRELHQGIAVLIGSDWTGAGSMMPTSEPTCE